MKYIKSGILLFVCAFTICQAALTGEEIRSNQKQYVSSVTIIDNQIVIKFDENVMLSKALYADDEGVYVFECDLEPIQSKDWTTWRCRRCGYDDNYLWSSRCERCGTEKGKRK